MDWIYLVRIGYVAAAVLFIVGLKQMAHPRTAVRGNLLGAGGMLLAVALAVCEALVEGYRVAFDRALTDGTEFAGPDFSPWYLIVGLIIGGTIGAIFALRVQMTAMPQMVALFNGFGGAASIFVALGALIEESGKVWAAAPNVAGADVMIATAASAIIGAVTFFGSLLAFGKLQEFDFYKRPIDVPYHQFISAALAVFILLLTVILVLVGPGVISVLLYIVILIAASALGLLLVNPIGGADMPVVIALLNSYSGLAAAATGFVINNNVLIISGSLVGASGIILTQLMCKAMNRSIVNVLFGSMESGRGAAGEEIYSTVRSTTAEDVALMLSDAQRVVFVPGYGMAVAQAQHCVRDLGNLLESKGITVEYAIHPVAGRMPGHMNVLLAEADVDYEKLKEMDHINPTMETVDVAIVIGANDTVNPVARTDPKCPIAGMPIVDVDKARTTIVIKRSLSPGFAGIPNPLFAAENTYMLFGDGQKAVLDIIAAIKAG